MRWMGLLLLAGCVAGEPDAESEAPLADELVLKDGTRGPLRFLHVGGLCSTSFLHGKKGATAPRLGAWPGIESIDARVDQTESMAVAVPQLAAHLDAHCTGEAWCYLYGYSNGGAVISQTLALYDSERWNILWVLTSASNEGGSEISGSGLAGFGDWLGVVCPLSDEVAPADHRAAWNHNDTGGNTIYLIAGHQERFYTGRLPDFFDGMANDGAVAYHSAGGLNDTYFIDDDEPWLCYPPEYHYHHHVPAFTCEGFDVNHGEMHLRGIIELGG